MIDELINRATATGLDLALVGDRVRVTPRPGAKPTRALIDELRDHHEEIAAALVARSARRLDLDALLRSLARVRPEVAPAPRRTITIRELRLIRSEGGLRRPSGSLRQSLVRPSTIRAPAAPPVIAP